MTSQASDGDASQVERRAAASRDTVAGRDVEADTKSREWARATRTAAEAGELSDDADFMAEQIAKEKQRLKRK